MGLPPSSRRRLTPPFSHSCIMKSSSSSRGPCGSAPWDAIVCGMVGCFFRDAPKRKAKRKSDPKDFVRPPKFALFLWGGESTRGRACVPPRAHTSLPMSDPTAAAVAAALDVMAAAVRRGAFDEASIVWTVGLRGWSATLCRLCVERCEGWEKHGGWMEGAP